jgi:hypothetical protein
MLTSSRLGFDHVASSNLSIPGLVAHPPSIREVNLALLAWLRSGDGDPDGALSRCRALLGRVARHGLEPDDRSRHILADLRRRAVQPAPRRGPPSRKDPIGRSRAATGTGHD